MRIIAGIAKGRALVAPKGKNLTRPALSKVREAIFSSVGDWTNFVVADFFAGTGSLGFEALSRGATKAYFIDDASEALKCIRQNSENLDFASQSTILRCHLPRGISKLKLNDTIDVLFCDPPYDKDLLNLTLQQLLKSGFIHSETLVIAEHSTRELPQTAGLKIEKQKKYGQTLISYLKKDHDH